MTRRSGSRRAMSHECGAMSAGRDGIAELVKTMLKLHGDNLALAAYSPDIPS